MAFVVDGSEWCFDGWNETEVVDAIENMLDRIHTARERDEIVWIGDDLQTRLVVDNLDLWSLSSPAAPIHIPTEVRQELAAWLGTAPRYLDEEQWPAGMTEILIQIGTESALENEDVAWAHHHIRAGRAVACLGLRRSGPHETISSLDAVTVHWVSDESSHRRFWRAAIDLEGDDEASLERISPHAFPDLHFIDGVWQGMQRLAGGYLSLRGEIKRYLGVLDDYGAWVFTCSPPALSPNETGGDATTGGSPTNQVIERRFLGFNLSIAPEKPNVYANAVCRRARVVTIGAKEIYCEWHAKLEPHRNRMHIHAPIPESRNRVVIAIFNEHLPLP